MHKKSKTGEVKAELMCAVCFTDQIWRESRSEFSTLLKMTPCCNADRWPDIIHPDFFSFPYFLPNARPTNPEPLYYTEMTEPCCLPSVCHVWHRSMYFLLLLGTPSITHSDSQVAAHISVALNISSSYEHLLYLYVLGFGVKFCSAF